MTIKDEDVEKTLNDIGYILINQHKRNSYKMVVIQDKNGYMFDVFYHNVIRDRKISMFDVSNPYTLKNLSLWLKLNNKTFELLKENSYKGNQYPLEFYCFTCKENFHMNLSSVYNTNCNCPVCLGVQVGKKTSFGFLHPEYIEEWSSKNAFSPYDITEFSNKNVIWNCSKCGNEWNCIPQRRSRGMDRPQCPHCFKISNRLSTNFPEISLDWNYDKNDGLTPEDFRYSSDQKVWWICEKGHEYFSSINNRTYKGNMCGCPICASSKGETKIRKILDYRKTIGAISNFETEEKFEKCRFKIILSFDFKIVIDEWWCLVEYQGIQHTQATDFGGRGQEWADEQLKTMIIRDNIKKQFCYDNNIPLLEISYLDFDNIEEILRDYLNI